MCGIVAYLGERQAYPILISGLKRLEYRGYDSSGVALVNGELKIIKKKGKVSALEQVGAVSDTTAHVGIGHTRWATHGEPNDINAHPHTGQSERIVIVHNGIIENYLPIKQALIESGHSFESQTDTEVLAHLIEEFLTRSEDIQLEEAVRLALNEVDGAYAIVVMDQQQPNVLVGARKSSPLVLGIGDGEYFFGSDATPLVEHTQRMIYLEDGEIARVDRAGDYSIRTLKNVVQKPQIEEISLKIEELEKGGYEHFMLKEIYQQPTTVADAMRGRLNLEEEWVQLGGLEKVIERVQNAKRLIIAACGTSWHSALIGEYLIEELARIPVEVEYASELRYRNPVVGPDDVVIAISQSGETADTLAAIELCKEKGAFIYGIVNTVGSSIARVTHSGSYIHAGPEIGVASTKAFTGQVAILTLLALHLGKQRNTITRDKYLSLLNQLAAIPRQIQEVLDGTAEHIRYLSRELKYAEHALYLGRGYNFPVALEGALKLKEISYIHAEGYPAAEMKHGPIALIDEKMPVIIIATNLRAYDKIVSNIQEVKARKGTVIAIVTEGDREIKPMVDHVIEIPKTADPLTPLLSVIPLQLLSYHIAVLRGCNVDQPRNLAKSVTVE